MKATAHLPTWYQALIYEASARAELAPRYRASYSDAGYHLALHWEDYLDREARHRAGAELDRLHESDVQGALRRLQQWFGGFLSAVPQRRKAIFAGGFLAEVSR